MVVIVGPPLTGDEKATVKNAGHRLLHLLRIKPEDLQTFHSCSARQRDITLTLLKHPAKIDLYAL